MSEHILRPIGYIHTDFEEKFGLPRQSGIVEGLLGEIHFEPAYRNPDALVGITGFSHLWLIWGFHKHDEKIEQALAEGKFSPMTRPPRLGGNEKRGVFATRSPFRPNGLGLSVVKLESVDLAGVADGEGPVIHVSGIDMLDGTPIYDIKPYVPYVDSIPGAAGGFTDPTGEGKNGENEERLSVAIPPELLVKIPEEQRENVRRLIAIDPRPAYQKEPLRIYGMAYAGMEIRFRVEGDRAVVVDVSSRINAR